MLQWAELDHAEPELRDESPSPSPSPNHHPLRHPFSIEAAVEFVARGASIWGLDAGIAEKNGSRCSYFCSYSGFSLARIFKNPLFSGMVARTGIEPVFQP